MSYKVKLNVFEGPFDLLVYLIEKAEMDIYDIRISEITSQYMEYVKNLKELNVAVSTEFMVLAAELIDIKTKMLIPSTENDEIDYIQEDPRSDLVERLVEYKKFKAVASMLDAQESKMQDIYCKPQEDISEYINAPDEYLALDIEQFAKAFEAFIHRKKKVEDVKKRYARVERQKATIEAKYKQIMESFRILGRDKVHFKELIENDKDKYDIVLTFSSLLELTKQRTVNLEQRYMYGDIEVTSRVKEDKIH